LYDDEGLRLASVERRPSGEYLGALQQQPQSFRMSVVRALHTCNKRSPKFLRKRLKSLKNVKN